MRSRPFVPMTSRVRPPQVGAVRGWLHEQSTVAMKPCSYSMVTIPPVSTSVGGLLLQDAVGHRAHAHRRPVEEAVDQVRAVHEVVRERHRPRTTAAG